ncbi:hypothetical protein DPEC_G00292200 [Dallia pectoralis]|uniref:Uncharacterized protein n=1 Tax=Dallia pectoralis TaxID=75939 RepID=A0ACC2FHT9_DALPE|nr:hypothetical protein DPEC_G00292200 [Dallia pectoralis]
MWEYSLLSWVNCPGKYETVIGLFTETMMCLSENRLPDPGSDPMNVTKRFTSVRFGDILQIQEAADTP